MYGIWDELALFLYLQPSDSVHHAPLSVLNGCKDMYQGKSGGRLRALIALHLCFSFRLTRSSYSAGLLESPLACHLK